MRRLLLSFSFCCVLVAAGGFRTTADAQTLEGAFIFGSRALECPIPGVEPVTNYTAVHHASGNNDGGAVDALDYTLNGAGWGYIPIDPENTGRGGWARFGPFDDSPNNRNQFDDACPNEIYDSTIGFKNFPQPCDISVAGNITDPCEVGDIVPGDPAAEPPVPDTDYVPGGGIFRIDVPNGFYRFVASSGDSNPHTNRLLAEDGGDGGPGVVGVNSVALVASHNQDQFGDLDGNRGRTAFARVGFTGHLPPLNEAVAGPIFVNMDETGSPTDCDPNSPVLEVTSGYIRIHQLQANSSTTEDTIGDRNGANLNMLELWRFDVDPEPPPSFSVSATRAIEGDRCAEPPVFTLTISATNVLAATTITETIPECATIVDNGGGVVTGSQIAFELTADGDVSYSIDIAGCCPTGDAIPLSGVVEPDGGCEGVVGGAGNVSCCPFVCDPVDETEPAELVGAYLFGSRDLLCPLRSADEDYTMVLHVNDVDGYAAITYAAELGYGFDPVYPNQADRGWSNDGRAGMEFGPFDDSPNNRNRFGDDCPEQMYDSFIGLKNFPQTCNEAAVGNKEDPCTKDTMIPGDPPTPYRPLGMVFRVDVPGPGFYRFAGIFGEADNPHANRVLAEDGGSGPPEDIGANYVTLVHNHDQAQWTHGQAKGDCLGCGVFARVGYNCRIPPLGDGIGADPQFVNMNAEGKPAGAGSDGQYGTADDLSPDSPVLEVTGNYVRIHMLQGNANGGPGGKGANNDRDPNGTDVVLLEVWKVSGVGAQIPGDCNGDGTLNITDVICYVTGLFPGFVIVGDQPEVACAGALDANGDGEADLNDLVSVAYYLFYGGDAISAACGVQFADCDTNPGCE